MPTLQGPKRQREPNGWHKASKASISSHEVEKERYASSKPTSWGYISQVVTSKQATRGTDATIHKQVAPKTNKLKPTGGTKHGKT